MTEFYKVIDNDYIIGIGTNGNDTATAISESEYSALLSVIRSAPSAPEGFVYKLRDDNLEWELVKLPEPEPIEEEAGPEDYEQALEEMGVDFSD